jgi:hypothetical protein
MKIFVINLDKAEDRWAHYKDDVRYTRWSATSIDDLSHDHPIYENMVSYWNVDPREHKAKCCCYLSHTRLWRYIVTNKINDVLILEDDAHLINPIPDSSTLPQDGFTYLGGLTYNKKLTAGPLPVEFDEGITKIDHSEYRLLMCLAIYIPHWTIAFKMLQSVEERGRPRAIDTMILHTKRHQYVSFPSSFVERPDPSQIRASKTKFSNSKYERVSAKRVLEEIEEGVTE